MSDEMKISIVIRTGNAAFADAPGAVGGHPEAVEQRETFYEIKVEKR